MPQNEPRKTMSDAQIQTAKAGMNRQNMQLNPILRVQDLKNINFLHHYKLQRQRMLMQK